MMGDTYSKIAEIKNEWMRQWARVVLLVERGIPPAQRLKEQDLYSERMVTGEKALVLKQTMSEEKLAEIQDIIEMKVCVTCHLWHIALYHTFIIYIYIYIYVYIANSR